MQVNVQFLQQLQPEWSRFVTVVKQRQEIDTVSYHKLFDVLKQFQNEVILNLSPFLRKSVNPEKSFGGTKDMQKNLALLAKYFKKLYKPTKNNLRTSSNSRNKTEDTTPRKPKRVKTTPYHKEEDDGDVQTSEQGGSTSNLSRDELLAAGMTRLMKQELEAHDLTSLDPNAQPYKGRSTFANPKYLKKAQSEKPRLYEIPLILSDPANRFAQWGRGTVDS
ncbi:hypothetical protein Tco_1101462 [Tanacetum coccineum]